MKNTKTKIILSAAVLLSFLILSQTAVAASPSLYFSPSASSKSAGSVFGISGGVSASGNKVCAVEGTLSFTNLSCQSITLTDGLVAQASPTCSNPHFLVGIPGCTASDKTLFSLSVRAGTSGSAFVRFTSADIIGEGMSLGSLSTSGTYTITSVSASPAVSSPPAASVPAEEVPSVTEEAEAAVTAPEQAAQTGVQQAAVAASSTGFSWRIWLLIALAAIILIWYGYKVFKVRQ